MAVNKVVYAGRTLVDLTGDSVTPDTLAEGVTAHAASGEGVTGTMTAVQYGKSQSLSAAQKTQARTNIGAASAQELSQLSAEIGTKVDQALTVAKESGEFDGADGVGVSSVKQTTTSSADGGSNVVTVTLTNGTTSTFTVKNGSKGSAGSAGKDGVSPVKGKDYWTPADQESIVQDVIAALGTPVFGTVDENNNVVLTGTLSEGTYTIKYENAEGEQTTIGTLTTTAAPKYTNVLPQAIGSDGKPYNGGQGWKTGYRLNSSGTETAEAGFEVTGFMPITRADTLYFADITMPYDGANNNKQYIVLYDSSFAKIIGPTISSDISKNGGSKYDADHNLIEQNIELLLSYYNQTDDKRNAVSYVRFSAPEITNDSIVTVNEPIE